MIITGTSSAGHLKENVAAGGLVLDHAIMSRLDAAGGEPRRDGAL